MPRYPWNDGSNQPDICNRPTLPKKYWIDDPASILPLPPSGRGIDDLRGARESVRVGESLKISFWTGWSVTGWIYAKKWRRRIGVGTVNSRETILPRRKDLLLLLLWNEISPHVPVPGSRLPLCQQDFFPPPVSSLRANPGMDVSQDFLPVKCSFSVVFLPVKSYRFVCALPFPTTLRRFSGGILDA